MSYTSTGGLPTIPRLAVAGVDEGAPGSASSSSGSSSGSSDPLTLTPRVTPAAPASGLKLYADATGKLSWIRASDGFTRTFEVTATANRTFTIPDASFTLAGQNLANTFTLANTFSANGALSAPAVSFTGTPITGGTATTTKPMVLVETSGATSTAWSTSGTMLGVNAPNAFAGNMVDFQINGVSRFLVTSGGSCQAAIFDLSTSGFFRAGSDTLLTRKTTANWQLGAADAAAPVAQTLSVQSVVAGTSNTAGVDWTLNGSRGTGTGSGGSIIFQTAPAGSTGSAQNTLVTQVTIPSAGGLRFGSSGSTAPYIFPFSGSSYGTLAPGGKGMALFSYVTTTASEDSFAISGTDYTATGGAHVHVRIQKSFAPTSGTAVYNHLQLSPTVNQTGGASGVSRGLYINPALTAAADFRALEISAGKTIFAANGALSEPAVSFTGTPITGGSSTTTKPLVLIETSGATSAAWSTAGTMLGVNAPSGFVGRLIDASLDGVSKFSVTSTGTVTSAGNFVLASAGVITYNSDTTLSRKAAANLQLGAADAASPVAQTLSVQSVVAGTTDTAGTNFTIKGSAGTGTGIGGSIVFQTAQAGSAGSSQNAFSTILTLGSNSSLTATFGGSVTVNSTSALAWSASRSLIRSPADGQLTLLNNAETGFDRLNFGGTTSSFGAVARNGTGIKITLASSSSTLSDLTCATVATAGYTVATLPAAGTAGRRAYVTDATAPTYLGALVGGGAVVCPVFDNGSAWVSA